LNLPSNPTLTECCSAIYSHPLARLVLGDSFHPGGLDLTTNVANMAGVHAGSRVLDGGSGRGTSAIHLAKSLGCHVTGVTLEGNGVVAGVDAARQNGVEELTTFIQGDLLTVDLPEAAYDVVLMECVLSILPEKPATIDRLKQALRPTGHLAITDVTVNGPIPEDLQGILAVAGCVADARSLDGYASLLENAEFSLEHTKDASGAVEGLLKNLQGKILMGELAIKLGKLPIDAAQFDKAKVLFKQVQRLVSEGTLSYGVLVARRS